MKVQPRFIDHTNLKPDATDSDIKKLCKEAIDYGFHSVCVNPNKIAVAFEQLGSERFITSVIGFPLGAHITAVKLEEAFNASYDAVDELDIVLDIGAIKDKYYSDIKNELTKFRFKYPIIILKAIIEVPLLTKEEIVKVSKLVKNAEFDYVKTSTGTIPGYVVSPKDIALIRSAVGPKMGIKASGGIKTYSQAQALLKAGANRLGCSRSVDIIKEELSNTGRK